MLTKCANPVCGAHFRYLNQGRIYNVPIYGPQAKSCQWPLRVEHYWLCSSCCMTLTLVFRNGRADVLERYALLTDGDTSGAPKQWLAPVAKGTAA